ncbi:actin bundling protein [Acanthamoeba castellanii str. Neff]|uniref:Actin bundling protein n=1 Tax=Acanthamoeba castellanii (strain ATCC 30010 / Neff) TaxID=1257118 RepID=L8GG08_ACACF|nr:actin bundling protein [Acanthamoeba castellanii str. Neff]ELR11648.1 actin bundling protein [Acanthamoeba castellanii str. Neff]
MSFTEKLDPEALAYFNNVCQKPFAQQAVAFLNAYWRETADQADFIFSVSWELIKYADMHSKGISLRHLYEEGHDLDFDIGLYFYEQLCKFVEDPKNSKWASPAFRKSQPEMLTAIKRKQELRDRVDVNFDGRVSFLEYLLYQYNSVANPADFCKRSMSCQDEHPEIRARLALEEVNKSIKAYEAERYRLTEEAKLPGVKGLKATNELAQLDASPLAEKLNKALITAEAAVRIAVRKASNSSETFAPTEGALWWMSRDLEEKQKHYGKKK